MAKSRKSRKSKKARKSTRIRSYRFPSKYIRKNTPKYRAPKNESARQRMARSRKFIKDNFIY